MWRELNVNLWYVIDVGFLMLLETSRERISRAIHYKLMSSDSFWRANAQEWCYPWQSRWWESPIIGQNWTEWKIGFLDVKECKLKRLRRFHRYRENWNSTRKISTTGYCSKKPIYRACMPCFIIIKKKKSFRHALLIHSGCSLPIFSYTNLYFCGNETR